MLARWQPPTIDTKFRIDLNWWTEQRRDMRLYLREMLCSSCRAILNDPQAMTIEIDWVDDQTGEVMRVDGLWHSLRTCCSTKPSYITPNTPIVEAVFRTFLANGNKPLSIRELYELLDRRPPQTLLRMLTADQVYFGIRPVRN